jgi:hypothetical protein
VRCEAKGTGSGNAGVCPWPEFPARQGLWPGFTAIILLYLGLAGCGTVPTSYKPDRPIAPDQFSHALFDAVLQAHVHEGEVDYAGISGDGRFHAYIRQLDQVDPAAFATREERLAFWINAYNAFAIQGILDGLSPATFWGRYQYFIARRYPVGGEEINLYDLERSILVKMFHEPRIHFAIVCASRSCPPLRSEAFVADRLEAQLDDQARTFINDPLRNRFDARQRVARLSMIFRWFMEDFVDHGGSLIAYVKPYLSDRDLVQDLDPARYTVQFLDYDWRLNGRMPERVAAKGGGDE